MNAGSESGQGRAGQFLFGLPFLLLGGYFVLAGLGVLPMLGKALVPLWIIACAGLVFFIPGVALVLSAVRSGRETGSVPGVTRVIRAREGRVGVLGAWGAALFSTALVTAFWGAILSDAPSSGNMPDWMAVAIIGLFTLVAVATVIVAAYMTLGMLLFGEAQLVLTPESVRVGGALNGYVELSGENLPAQVNVRLQCFRFAAPANVAKSGKAAAVLPSLKSAWEDSKVESVTVMAGRSRIILNIPIPEGLAPSHMPAESANSWVVPGQAQVYCQWFLRVSADVPGVDLTRTFTVDVLAEEKAESGVAPDPESGSEPDLAAAATKVALAELAAGRTPAAVAGRLEGLGVSDAVMRQVFNEIGGDESRPFAPALRSYQANLARIQAEVDSGQLILLGRARGPAQSKKRPGSAFPVTTPVSPHAPISGAPVLLADESVLCRGKWIIGGLLLVWGGLFGGIPAATGIMDASQRSGGLFFMFLLGSAAVCGGIWLIARRHSIWLLPGQDRIEERTGVFRADQFQYRACADFDRVVVAKSVSRSSKGGTSVTFHVALTRGDTRQDDSMGLGDFSEYDESRAAGARVAAHISLPLYDLTIGAEPVPVTVVASPAASLAMTASDPVWWRQSSAVVLLLANLVPVGGVLFAQWEVFPIMLLFWLENLIVGMVTALKMLTCQRGHLGEKLFTVPFFVVHYGGFCTGHGIFVISLFGPKSGPGPDLGGFLPDPAGIFQLIQQQGLWIAVIALAASHGFSYVVNYLGRGEHRTAEVGKLMLAPYSRIVLLHVVIIFGGFLVMALGAPLIALLMLVILKIILDVAAHLREHRRKSDAAILAGITGTSVNP